MKRKFCIFLVAALVGSVLLTACQLPFGIGRKTQPVATPSVVFRPGTALGIQGDATTFNSYPGIPWVRLSYPTCVTSNLSGQVLKDTINSYHTQGMRVLLTYCQTNGASLFDMNGFNDVAQAGADAVQCGNEQMKQSATTLYVTPDRFARFFDLCQSAIRAVQPGMPIILGAMDPLVVPYDDAKLENQVHYLDDMQAAMNSSVHAGGNWDWRSQILGLIDSWHNGYPSADTNNLY